MTSHINSEVGMQRLELCGKNVSFLAVGPQRTASSWLDRALRAHPCLALPENVKETFFFDKHYDRGVDWYLSHFKAKSEEVMLAEVGSTYFESLKALERIRSINPGMKIIVTVRNPIARSFSSFGHEYAKGRASGNFFEAIENLPRIIDSGRYSILSPEWEGSFGRGQVFYVLQDDIEKDPQGQLDTIFDFLGVERVDLPEELQGRFGQGFVPRFWWLAAVASRSASALRRAGLHRLVEVGKRLGLKRIYSGGDQKVMAMTQPIFEYLLAEHDADIRFLEKRLGRTLSHWRSPEAYGLKAD